jgi:hypothetical protein
MAAQVVTYALDESTLVRFEIDPVDLQQQVAPDRVAGQVRDAVEPAVKAAKAVLDRIRELSPDRVDLKFGIKADTTANWLIAKATAEANFEVTLSWSPTKGATAPSAAVAAAQPEAHAEPEAEPGPETGR